MIDDFSKLALLKVDAERGLKSIEEYAEQVKKMRPLSRKEMIGKIAHIKGVAIRMRDIEENTKTTSINVIIKELDSLLSDIKSYGKECERCYHLDYCVTEQGENPMCNTKEKECFLSAESVDQMESERD